MLKLKWIRNFIIVVENSTQWIIEYILWINKDVYVYSIWNTFVLLNSMHPVNYRSYDSHVSTIIWILMCVKWKFVSTYTVAFIIWTLWLFTASFNNKVKFYWSFLLLFFFGLPLFVSILYSRRPTVHTRSALICEDTDVVCHHYV